MNSGGGDRQEAEDRSVRGLDEARETIGGCADGTGIVSGGGNCWLGKCFVHIEAQHPINGYLLTPKPSRPATHDPTLTDNSFLEVPPMN